MDGASYFLETFGCQMNILDSQLIEAGLQARGLRPVSDHRRADVILFNTCSVRQHAEDKVRSRLGALRSLKRRRPELIVGVLGCMAERVGEALLAEVPEVDLLCGPDQLHRLGALIDEVRERRVRLAALAGHTTRKRRLAREQPVSPELEELDLSRPAAGDGDVLQSYLRVQRGCDRFCTYCVVPFVRGPQRSRPPENIIAEARRLEAAGCRELTLLGQTVNSYACPERGGMLRLAGLLERVHEQTGIDRIRFVTSFPAEFDEDIFRVMRDCPRVMPYLHIPAQSGSDRVLARMGRNYTAASYLRLIDQARRYVPHIALAGDFIVGFCGETEEEFRETLALVRQAEYDSLFVFKYSPRPGTRAERLAADDVPAEVKAVRHRELLALQNEISLRRKRALLGQTVEVLVEGPSKAARRAAGESRSELRTRGKHTASIARRRSEHPSPSPPTPRETVQLVGRTPGDALVVFEGPAGCRGALARVSLERATPQTFFGRLVEVVSPPRLLAPAAALPPAAGG